MKFWNLILITLMLVFASGTILFFSTRLKVNPSYPIVFSPKTMLNELWERYKEEYIEPETNRTLDKQRNNITTSEGQSYTMLRAVWQDDKITFEQSWQWTKDILRREEDDNLFSWLFGEKEDGTYDILREQGGYNTASDGDTDIALALAFGFARWNDWEYLRQARLIVNDIWEQEVITIQGKPYLAANNLEKESTSETIIVNPSYLAPYAYKVFAMIDKDHPWGDLVDSSYEVLEKAGRDKLDTEEAIGLAPDWLFIDRKTGEFRVNYSSLGLTSNYGFDAMRIPWRIALDWIWNKDERAKKVLNSYRFLEEEWVFNKQIYSTYSHDGRALLPSESHAMYGTAIAYFIVEAPEVSTDIYQRKLKPLYNPDKQGWASTLGYYDDNWVWFGMAMYNNELPNLGFNLDLRFSD